LSYKNKTTGGGQIDPPPSRNRVKEMMLTDKAMKFEIEDAREAP